MTGFSEMDAQEEMVADSPQMNERPFSPLLAPELDRAIADSVVLKRHRARNRTLLVHFGQLGFVVLILGSWEISSRLGWLPNAQLFYSRPSEIWTFISQHPDSLYHSAVATFGAALVALALGVVTGLVCGLFLGQAQTFDRIVDPVITVINGIPRIALAPLFLLWFGITVQAKVFLGASIVFFVVLLNARAGVRSVDEDMQTVIALLGAKRRQVFSKVVIPASLPVLFGALRLGIVFSVLGVIASEMTAAKSGLGLLIVSYAQLLNPAGVFAVLAVLAVLMVILNSLVRIVESHFLKWRDDR
jgi:NitT/TauT family transport system permease protein